MKPILKKTSSEDVAYRIMMFLIYFMMIALVFIPIGSATSGEVIVFYRENTPLGGDLVDVGHVGVAIQLEDGTWVGGAVEGPGGIWGIIGTSDNNGGWSDKFKTREDVIAEFESSSHHAAYTAMKSIQVREINGNAAKSEIEGFGDKGFAIWHNNDCYTRVYDAMKAYGVPSSVLHDNDGVSVGEKDWLRPPKDFFNDLPGVSTPLPLYKPSLSSFLKLNSPLLPSPTSDTSPSDSTKGPYVPPTTTKTAVSYSCNMPGNWIMHIGSTPKTATFTLADVRNEVLSEFPGADLSKIESMGRVYIGGTVGWWTVSETAPGVYEVYGMIGSPFSGTISETGLIGWVGARMGPMHAEKIGDSPIKKIVTTYNVPSNVAGVGPLGGGGRSW